MIRFSLVLIVAASGLMAAQTADLYTPNQISARQSELAKKGRFASETLQKYDNHYTMLAHREATGSAEVHEHEADVFFITEGDARIVTGGEIVGSHEEKPGELRGTSIKGGETRALKTGAVIHIPAGMPHQILVTPGKPITYFVVKVTGQ